MLFMNNTLYLFFARNFESAQGVCLLDTGFVLLHIEDVRTGKNNAVITRNNCKNNKAKDTPFVNNDAKSPYNKKRNTLFETNPISSEKPDSQPENALLTKKLKNAKQSQS